MAVVSSAAQFFSVPAPGSPAGVAAGAASLFGNGGGASLGVGLVDPTGQAAEAVATFENLLAALINGDGATVENALQAAVADGAVTMDHGKLALGPALQQIAPAGLANGKPALDQLIADGKAASAASLLAMLLNGDGDAQPIQIDVSTEDAASDEAPAAFGAFQIQPVPVTDQGKAPKPTKPVITVETHTAPSTLLAVPPAVPTETPVDHAPAQTDAIDAQPAVLVAAETHPTLVAPVEHSDATIDVGTDEDAQAAREQAALDLMAALLAQQPAAPVSAAPKTATDLTIEAAAAPAEPARFTGLPADIAAAPKLMPGTAMPAPDKMPDSEPAPDFAGELASPHVDVLPSKHLVAAKNEQRAQAAASETLAPVAARPINDGAPAAPQSATSNSSASSSAASVAVNTGGSDTNSNANSNGQQPDGGQRQPSEIDLLRSGAVTGDSGRAGGHQDFASQLTSSSRGSQGSSGPQLPAFQQVAVQIRRAVVDGDDHVSIQLKPVELGRIDVRLHFTGDGRVSAHVTADNLATLDLMQRDTRGLERALQDAGLQTDAGSLSFNLRGDNRQAHDQENRGHSNNARFMLDGPVELEPEELPAGRWVPAGRVDVRV